MRLTATIAVIVGLLTACTLPQEPRTPQFVVEDALKAETNCALTNIPKMDDGVSDASTVALAIAQVCASEYRRVTNAYGSANLDNQNQRNMFQQRRNSTSEKIENFLPFVLAYRNSAKASRSK